MGEWLSVWRLSTPHCEGTFLRVLCSVIVIDRSDGRIRAEAPKTFRLANSSQVAAGGKEQTTDGRPKWYMSGVLTRNEKLSRSAKDKEIAAACEIAEAGSTENESAQSQLDDGGGQITEADPASSPTASGFIPFVPQSTDADAATSYCSRGVCARR